MDRAIPIDSTQFSRVAGMWGLLSRHSTLGQRTADHIVLQCQAVLSPALCLMPPLYGLGGVSGCQSSTRGGGGGLSTTTGLGVTAERHGWGRI